MTSVTEAQTAMEIDNVEVPNAPTPGPIPMSFPAVLRNPKLADRFAHLRIASSVGELTPLKIQKNNREDREGKRWIRRKDNGQQTPDAIHIHS